LRSTGYAFADLVEPPPGFTKAVYLKVAIFRDGHVEHEARMIASYDTCRFTDLDTVSSARRISFSFSPKCVV
jgi:hypothetical protein